MAFDLKAWLTDLGVGGDDVALIETKLAPHAPKVEASVLRQSDYSTKLNEITTLKAEITAKDQRLAAEAADWAGMTAAEQARSKGLQDSIEKLQADKLKLTQRLTRTAISANLDPASVMEGLDAEVVAPPANQPPAAPAPDMSKYVTAEQHRALAGMAVRLPAQLMRIAREHRALTGEEVDEQAIITEIETRATTRGNQKSLDPQQVWEELHQIPAKRQAKSQAELDQKLSAAREEGRMEALSTAAVPGGSPRGKSGPVFLRPGHGESKLQRPQAAQGIAGAVAAFDSGKYRVERTKTA